jgi:hypothetical protein
LNVFQKRASGFALIQKERRGFRKAASTTGITGESKILAAFNLIPKEQILLPEQIVINEQKV